MISDTKIKFIGAFILVGLIGALIINRLFFTKRSTTDRKDTFKIPVKPVKVIEKGTINELNYDIDALPDSGIAVTKRNENVSIDPKMSIEYKIEQPESVTDGPSISDMTNLDQDIKEHIKYLNFLNAEIIRERTTSKVPNNNPFAPDPYINTIN